MSVMNPMGKTLQIFSLQGEPLEKYVSNFVADTEPRGYLLQLFVSAYVAATAPRVKPLKIFLSDHVAATTPTSDEGNKLNISLHNKYKL